MSLCHRGRGLFVAHRIEQEPKIEGKNMNINQLLYSIKHAQLERHEYANIYKK